MRLINKTYYVQCHAKQFQKESHCKENVGMKLKMWNGFWNQNKCREGLDVVQQELIENSGFGQTH